MKKQFRVVVNGSYPPQVGGLDEFGYIFKIICYFVHQASDWKDSFFQTDYIIKKVLEKDCPLKKSGVTSILELISDAGLIKQVHKYKNRLRGWTLLMKLESNKSQKMHELIINYIIYSSLFTSSSSSYQSLNIFLLIGVGIKLPSSLRSVHVCPTQ